MSIIAQYDQNLLKLKAAIHKQVAAWHEIAGLLIEIKESRGWVEKYKTWDKFCEACCRFTRQHADALIRDQKAFDTITETFTGFGLALPPQTQQLPQSTVREIATLKPAQQAAVINALEDPPENQTTAEDVSVSFEALTTPNPGRAPKSVRKAIRKAIRKTKPATVIDASTGKKVTPPPDDPNTDPAATVSYLVASGMSPLHILTAAWQAATPEQRASFDNFRSSWTPTP